MTIRDEIGALHEKMNTTKDLIAKNHLELITKLTALPCAERLQMIKNSDKEVKRSRDLVWWTWTLMAGTIITVLFLKN